MHYAARAQSWHREFGMELETAGLRPAIRTFNAKERKGTQSKNNKKDMEVSVHC
jgi:hypothetical protein